MNFVFRALTEIDFLSRQTMVFDSSVRSTIGTLATITPAANLTFVLLGAHFACIGAGFGASTGAALELRNEANVRDRLGFGGFAAGGSSSSGSFGSDFSLVKGDTLDGDGIKTYTLEWTSEVGNLSIVGSLYGYLRNT